MQARDEMHTKAYLGDSGIFLSSNNTSWYLYGVNDRPANLMCYPCTYVYQPCPTKLDVTLHQLIHKLVVHTQTFHARPPCLCFKAWRPCGICE